jgi:hypothetical protein
LLPLFFCEKNKETIFGGKSEVKREQKKRDSTDAQRKKERKKVNTSKASKKEGKKGGIKRREMG